MADIVYGGIHDVYGKDSFVERDYREYLAEHNMEGRFMEKSKIAGLILYDEDTYATIEGFVRMCSGARPSIIVIEFCNIVDKRTTQKYRDYAKNLINELGIYVDLQSYETKLSFGLQYNYF